MASAMNGAGNNSEATRYKNYLSQLERQQDADYNVQISNEAETLERKLALTRERNNILISQERERGEKESDRIRTQYQQKMENEKKVGDEQLARLQDYYKKAAEEQARQFNKEQVRQTQKGSPS